MPNQFIMNYNIYWSTNSSMTLEEEALRGPESSTMAVEMWTEVVLGPDIYMEHLMTRSSSKRRPVLVFLLHTLLQALVSCGDPPQIPTNPMAIPR